MKDYHVSGSLPPQAKSYVLRKADEYLDKALTEGQLCYVFNAPQTGKSSLKVAVNHKLRQKGFICGNLDLKKITQQNISQKEWYLAIITSLATSLGIKNNLDVRSWWQQQDEGGLSLVEIIDKFFANIILAKIPEKIVIFIDEIEAIKQLNFSTNEFFQVIEKYENNKLTEENYQRLTFCLLGVMNPLDLITEYKINLLKNSGRAIELDNFTIEEVKPLALGLIGKVKNPRNILEKILAWTGGQPFLTQKICQLLADRIDYLSPKKEDEILAKIIRKHILDNWAENSCQDHFQAIYRQLFSNTERLERLLAIYLRILKQKRIPLTNSNNRIEYIDLKMTGLVNFQARQITLVNPIYQEIFSQTWVEEKLNSLRLYKKNHPYFANLQAWDNSGQQDDSRLLRGKALQEALLWSEHKQLSKLEQEFLQKSQEFAQKEAETFEQMLDFSKEVQAKNNQILNALEAEITRLWQEQKNTETHLNNTFKFNRVAIVFALIFTFVLVVLTFVQTNIAIYASLFLNIVLIFWIYYFNKNISKLKRDLKFKSNLLASFDNFFQGEKIKYQIEKKNSATNPEKSTNNTNLTNRPQITLTNLLANSVSIAAITCLTVIISFICGFFITTTVFFKNNLLNVALESSLAKIILAIGLILLFILCLIGLGWLLFPKFYSPQKINIINFLNLNQLQQKFSKNILKLKKIINQANFKTLLRSKARNRE